MSSIPSPVPLADLAVSQRALLTRSVREWMAGSDRPGDACAEAIMNELTVIASRILSGQPPGHTLQVTALLNELWL
jgi:hypothetical protein